MTILRLAYEKEELNVISSQIGSPTSARLIDETTLLCIKQSIHEKHNRCFSSGLYNLCAAGYTNWYEFSLEILTLVRANESAHFKLKHVEKVSVDQYKMNAMHLMSSRLCTTLIQEKFKLFLPSWKKGLQLCIEKIADKARYSGASYE